MPDAEPTLLEDAIEIPVRLEADRCVPFDERLGRDRRIARSLPEGDALATVRAWRRSLGEAPATDAGARLERWRALVGLLMLVVGALAGGALALAAFSYDGTYPVNVVRVLGLLVVLPLGLLLLTLLLIPPRVPGLRALQALAAEVNPGAVGAALLGRLSGRPAEIARLLDRHATRSAAARRFAKWQMLYWSQLAGSAFGVASLATGGALIAFTDLAFGWSTTLTVDSRTVHRIVSAIALPWQAFVPEAVPSLELVERSQYFRLEGGGAPSPAPRALTGWWPFTLLAIATYALLPRLVLASLAAARLKAATRALLLDNADVTALLDRLTMPAIETRSGAPPEPAPEAGGEPPRAPGRLSGRASAVVWCDSVAPAAVGELVRERFGLAPTVVVEAGSSTAIGDDAAAIERLAVEAPRAVVVLAPAWEPPLLEFVDFLVAVRERIGPDASIVVALVPEADGAVSDVERGTWEQTVAKTGDTRAYVEAGAA